MKKFKKILLAMLVLMLVAALAVTAYADGVDAYDQTAEVSFKNQFLEAALGIVKIIVTAVAGYIGISIRNLARRYIDNDEKRAVASTVVKFVEQVYTDIHGNDKLNKALEQAESIFAEKGIYIGSAELRALIEAAVNEMNKSLSGSLLPASESDIAE